MSEALQWLIEHQHTITAVAVINAVSIAALAIGLFFSPRIKE